MAEKDIKINEKTIWLWLIMDFGLKSCRPAQKPRLTEEMKKKRLEFTKNILTVTQRCEKMFCFQMNPQ